MKQPKPLNVGSLAGVGMTLVGTVVVGLLLGLAAARYLGWPWAVPVGIIFGFIAGMVSMFRQLRAQM